MEHNKLSKKYMAVFVCLLCFVSLSIFADSLSAKQIISKLAGNKIDARRSTIKILSTRKGSRKKKIYKINLYSLKNSGGTKSLLVIVEPASLKGMAYYIDQKGDDKRFFVYMPKQGEKLTRVDIDNVSGGESGIFNTDFNPSDFYFDEKKGNEKRLPDQVLNGVSCYVIQVTKNAGKPGSFFNKKLIYIDKNKLVILKLLFYKDKELVKEYLIKKTKEIDNKWVPIGFVIRNIKRKSRTLVALMNIYTGAGSVNPSIFTRRSIFSHKGV